MTPKVSPPLSPELAALEVGKRVVVWIEREGKPPEPYVTQDFHDAWMAEMRARWKREVESLTE